MTNSRGRSSAISGLFVLALAAAVAGWITPAFAQELTKDQQKCINALNKDFQKVAGTLGKDACACIKNFGKGKIEDLGPGGTAESCLSADVKGKVAKSRDKLLADFASSCVGNDKNGAPKLPPYGTIDPNDSIAVAVNKENKLIHDLFGSDLDANLSQEKDIAKCQVALAKSSKKCQDTILKGFNKCKKDGLKSKGGQPPAIQSPEDLEACMGVDPKGKIAKACDDPAKPDKIRKDIDKKCVAKAVDLSDAFPGCATDDGAELHTCVHDAAACRACIAINEADGIRATCPGCSPDVPVGTVAPADTEAFCVGGFRDGLACTSTLIHSDCPPGPGGNPPARCLAATHFLINTVSAQPQLTLAAGFDMNIDCTTPDPVTGVADCTCLIDNIVPIEIPIIGFVCIGPFAGCDGGFVDCDGGELADVESVGDHDIGDCGLTDDPNESDPNNLIGPEECLTQCEAFCTAEGADFEVFAARCEGYCLGGSEDGTACTFDADCPDGECLGAEAVPHRGTCNCTCIRHFGQKARPGEFVCETGVAVQVEIDKPCQTEDGIPDVQLNIGSQCVPVTTATALSQLRDANIGGGMINSPARSGHNITCGEILAGAVDPLFMAGNMVFFDSALGDLLVPMTFAFKE